MVITNGKRMLDVNKSFLDFFNFKNVDEFLVEHSCICDKFLPGEGYLQKKVSEDENWLAHLINNKESTHKVEIADTDANVHIFHVNHQRFMQDSETIYVVSFEDITQLEEEMKKSRQKDKQLLEQSRLAQMGEMIAMIAHQWRQPLSAISAASSAIKFKAQREKLDNAKAVQLAEKITEYSKHLSNTIDDFRDFFRTNKESSKTDFTQLTQDALRFIQGNLTLNEIRIIKEFQTHREFFSHINELKQVLLNLIKNAEDILVEKKIKSPFIKLHSYETPTCICLDVSDNGGGIPEEILPKIFDPYFSTKTKKDGTGLGL